jgi:hypothetical protein
MQLDPADPHMHHRRDRSHGWRLGWRLRHKRRDQLRRGWRYKRRRPDMRFGRRYGIAALGLR